MNKKQQPNRISTILRIIDSDPEHPKAINHYWSLPPDERLKFASKFLNGTMPSNDVIYIKVDSKSFKVELDKNKYITAKKLRKKTNNKITGQKAGKVLADLEGRGGLAIWKRTLKDTTYKVLTNLTIQFGK